LKRCFPVLLLLCLTLGASVARADRSAFWRYAGGMPTYVGSRSCALSSADVRDMRVFRRKGYDMCFAPYLKSCLWVAYSLTPFDVSNQVGRVGAFRQDDDLREGAADPKAYRGAGYDRGHMAPSQDMQYDLEVSRQSFWMGNILPQTPRLNRGRWKALEGEIHRKVVPNAKGEVSARRVYVLAGPVFSREALSKYADEQKKYKVNGSTGEAPLIKPNAYWKIYKCGVRVRAVVMEQGAPDENGFCNVVVRDDVSVSEISQITGLSFFGGMDHDLREYYLNCHYGVVGN